VVALRCVDELPPGKKLRIYVQLRQIPTFWLMDHYVKRAKLH
jgi:hypothetical protein